MSTSSEILRIAAKGDGVTADGRHVRHAAPGDVVAQDGTITPGAHHASPVCRHFPQCGGCQLQHCDDASLATFVHERVVNAAAGQGLVPETVLAPAMSPPNSRRRVALRIINGGGRPLMGFSEGGSHRLVDLRECHVMAPELFATALALRHHFRRLKGKYAIGLDLAATDQGVACALSGFTPEGLQQTEDLLDLCQSAGLARLTLDHGYGPEAFWEPEPVTVSFAGVAVAFPPAAFLQATRPGEAALVAAASGWLEGCDKVADLFAGLGTFALPLAQQAGGRRVLAAEADKAAILALRAASGRAGLAVDTAHRDLFRNPLRAEELAGFNGLVLDPPRAGARAQVEQIAASSVPRVVYVSCNPSSWSRDGALLAAAGYTLAEVRPVGQFRWSTHVELVSLFVKRG